MADRNAQPLTPLGVLIRLRFRQSFFSELRVIEENELVDRGDDVEVAFPRNVVDWTMPTFFMNWKPVPPTLNSRVPDENKKSRGSRARGQAYSMGRDQQRLSLSQLVGPALLYRRALSAEGRVSR